MTVDTDVALGLTVARGGQPKSLTLTDHGSMDRLTRDTCTKLWVFFVYIIMMFSLKMCEYLMFPAQNAHGSHSDVVILPRTSLW
jgi:hypothetical protein